MNIAEGNLFKHTDNWVVIFMAQNKIIEQTTRKRQNFNAQCLHYTRRHKRASPSVCHSPTADPPLQHCSDH